MESPFIILAWSLRVTLSAATFRTEAFHALKYFSSNVMAFVVTIAPAIALSSRSLASVSAPYLTDGFNVYCCTT